VRVAGEPARAMRLSFVGELGWELHVPNTSSVRAYQAIRQAGAQFGLVNAGYRAIDSLSIEKGLKWTPKPASREFHVRLSIFAAKVPA